MVPPTYGQKKPNPTTIRYANDAPAGSAAYFNKLKGSLSASKSAVNKYSLFRKTDSPTEHPAPTATLPRMATLTALDADDGAIPDGLPTDQRERTLAIVRLRRGQSVFRNALINKYGPSCMVSGCTIMDIVEACHIHPYHQGALNSPENGLLLRADLHILFDTGLLGIDPSTRRIVIAPALVGTEYAPFNNQPLRDASRKTIKPSGQLLAWHAQNVFRS